MKRLDPEIMKLAFAAAQHADEEHWKYFPEGFAEKVAAGVYDAEEYVEAGEKSFLYEFELLSQNHQDVPTEDLLAAMRAASSMIERAFELVDEGGTGATDTHRPESQQPLEILKREYPGFPADVYQSAFGYAQLVLR